MVSGRGLGSAGTSQVGNVIKQPLEKDGFVLAEALRNKLASCWFLA
jgi:hypothetical protein